MLKPCDLYVSILPKMNISEVMSELKGKSALMKFIIGIPSTVGFACNTIEELRGTIRSHHNFCSVCGDELYAVTKPMT